MTLTELGLIVGKEINCRISGSRWIASFPYVDISKGIMLHGTYGEGETKQAAKVDYAKKLCGNTIAVNYSSCTDAEYFKIQFQV